MQMNDVRDCVELATSIVVLITTLIGAARWRRGRADGDL
jgi:hypothetical protein